jgi:hypothetical protein
MPAAASSAAGHDDLASHPDIARLISDQHLGAGQMSHDYTEFAGAGILPMVHAISENAGFGHSAQGPAGFHDGGLVQAPHAHFHA